MAIKLKDELQKSIKEFLNVNLPSVITDNGKFINRKSTYNLLGLDDIIAGKQPAKELGAAIGDDPLFHFVSETIGGIVYDTEEYVSDRSKPIIELAAFSPLEVFCDRLIADLTSLPWRYTYTFPLPDRLNGLLESSKDQATLGDGIRLVRVTSDLFKTFPQPAQSENAPIARGLLAVLAGIQDLPFWSIGDVALQIEEEGFVGKFDFSSPTKRAESKLKSFLGIMIALSAVQRNSSYTPQPMKRRFMIHRLASGSWSAEREHDLDDEFNKLFDKLALQGTWIEFAVDLASLAFARGDHPERLRLAGRWLFDSYATDRDLLAFVQAMVCMEILLGHGSDYQEASVGAIIRNRCAYLIAANSKERDEIEQNIKEIYKIRSNIVHTGKEHLTGNDSRMLATLRSYCSRVIFHDLDALRKAK